MKGKHKKNLDEGKLTWACELIKAIQSDPSKTPLARFDECLVVLTYADISVQDIRDFMEAIGWS